MSDGKGSDDWASIMQIVTESTLKVLEKHHELGISKEEYDRASIMQIVTESTFKVLEKHPEIGISKEEYRAELKKTHPEWLPDLRKEEMQ
jgi:hypothetical protein